MTYTDGFDLIFRGSVKSIGTCNELNKAKFLVQDLYKGSSPREIEVLFDCSSDCAMNFAVGETWIIYSNYAQVGKPDVNMCSRSRKMIDNEIKIFTDYIPSDLSFNDEAEWLLKNLGRHDFLKENENEGLSHKNELPSPQRAIVLVAVSLAGMLLLYFILKRFLK